MRIVADSRRRVALLEAAVVEDRRAVARAASRVTAHVVEYLSRPGTVIVCYAAGTLLGASGADVSRHLMRLARQLLSAGMPEQATGPQSPALRR